MNEVITFDREQFFPDRLKRTAGRGQVLCRKHITEGIDLAFYSIQFLVEFGELFPQGDNVASGLHLVPEYLQGAFQLRLLLQQFFPAFLFLILQRGEKLYQDSRIFDQSTELFEDDFTVDTN
ncbi:MAG: hypothetical protein EOM73_17125 [Bacteroidia bacterium]|nr:hypothetical protein [Bacteroidia bacterium]